MLALLVDPELEHLALARYAERTAAQYKHEGAGEAGKGDLVLCIDLSSSMRCNISERMTRGHYAAGVGVALFRLAKRQGRKVRLIGFNQGVVYDEQPTTDARSDVDVSVG